jgi:hypothetical protein
MKALVCELCGGNELIKEDGLYRCMHCGTRYTVEEAKALFIDGPVEVEGIAKKENLLKREKEARERGDIELAIDYCNRVLDLDFENETARKELDELNKTVTKENVVIDVQTNEKLLLTIDGKNALLQVPLCYAIKLEAGKHDICLYRRSLVMKLANGEYPIEDQAEIEIKDRYQIVYVEIRKQFVDFRLEISEPKEPIDIEKCMELKFQDS